MSGLLQTKSLYNYVQSTNALCILLDFVKNAGEIQDLAVLYSTTPDEAQVLVERVSSIFPKDRIILARLGPALGVHGGPGILAIALRTKGLRQTVDA